MTYASLTRKMNQIPTWAVSTVLSILLGAVVTWVTWASVMNWKHEVRITTVEARVSDVKDDIREIKDTQKRMDQKLDQLLERRPGR